MRHLRTLGLGLVAALALAVLGGASGASAATLCNANIAPCPAVNIVPPPFPIDGALIGPATFTMGPNTITCGTSGFRDRISNNPGAPINGLISNWTFGNCTLQPGAIPCTVVAIPAPPPLAWPTRISTPGTVLPGSQGDFAADNFDFTVTCGGLPVCTISGPGGPRTVVGGWFNPVVGSPPKPFPSPHAEVAFNAVPVVGGPAPCGGGTFTGAYEVTQAPWVGPDLWLF